MPFSLPSARAILKQGNVPALLVTDLINIRYLTGTTFTLGRLLILPKKIVLFVDNRYREKAQKQVRSTIAVRPYEQWYGAVAQLSRCGFEAGNVTVEQLSRWKKNISNTKFVQKRRGRKIKNTKFVQTENCIEFFRRSKGKDELQAIRKACSITRSILRSIPQKLRAGITEQDLAWHITSLAHEKGADGLAFDPIVAFGNHTSRPHHEITKRTFKYGDIVQIDMGVQYHGYMSDYSRVYFTAEPTSEQQKCYQALLKAKKSAENLLCAGVTNHALDKVARGILREAGIEHAFTHGLGHGVGLEIHEGVSLSLKAPKTTLLTCEVVTIEPGVYFPGKWGMRVEDTYVVQ